MLTFTIAVIGATIALQSPPEPTVPPASGDTPLAGPTMDAPAGGIDLIGTMTYDGRLEEIYAEPDVIAVEQLQLTQEQRGACNAILDSRRQLANKLVFGNYDLVVALGAIGQDGELSAGDLKLLGEIWAAFEPYRARGQFLDEIRDILTPEQVGIVWKATAGFDEAHEAQITKEKPEAARWEIQSKMAFERLGQLIQDTIESRAGAGADDFKELIAAVELRPEQQRKWEAALGPLAIQEYQGKDVKQKQFWILMELVGTLEDAQKKAFWEYAAKQGWGPGATE